MNPCSLQPPEDVLAYDRLRHSLDIMMTQARLYASANTPIRDPPLPEVVDLAGADVIDLTTPPKGRSDLKRMFNQVAEVAEDLAIKAAAQIAKAARAAVSAVKKARVSAPVPTGMLLVAQITLTSTGRSFVVPHRSVLERVIPAVHGSLPWVKRISACLEIAGQPADARPDDMYSILPHPHLLVVRLTLRSLDLAAIPRSPSPPPSLLTADYRSSTRATICIKPSAQMQTNHYSSMACPRATKSSSTSATEFGGMMMLNRFTIHFAVNEAKVKRWGAYLIKGPPENGTV